MGKVLPRTNRLSNRAFTVVELMIVIVIIGILGTILYVSYKGVQHRAEVVIIMSDLANLSDEMKFFYKDNGRYPVVYPAVYGDPLPELEAILKTTGLYEDTRYPDPKKTFIFCTPTKLNPQRFVIIGREFDESATDTLAPTLHYATSDHALGTTPMIWTDAITNADPAGKYGSNACNTISLKTGVSYFSTGMMRWSFDVPQMHS